MLPLQKHMAPFLFVPVLLGKQYPHRIHKDYSYSEEVRKIIVEKRASYAVSRIFALQENKPLLFKNGIQNWVLKVMADQSVMFSCFDEKGRVVYFEHGDLEEPPLCDLSFTLYKKVLHTKRREAYS